eukprot:gene20489-30447_t
MGLMTIIGPVVDTVDTSVKEVFDSQAALEVKIDALQEELQKFDGLSEIPGVLEEYTAKLAQSRKKVTAVNNLLTQVQERVNRLNTNAMRAAKKRQAELGITNAE